MTTHTVANAVTYHETGSRTVEFECTCGLTHSTTWPVGKLELHARADCGTSVTVAIPQWAFATRSYAKLPQRSHLVHPTARDDNAFDDPAINWEE